MTLGEYINNYLIEHDVSIREFARLADISHTYVSYIVNGKTGRGTMPVLTIDKYKKIARAMNMDVHDLLTSVDAVDISLKEPDDNKETRGDILEALRILDSVARDAPKSVILEAAALIQRYKEQNNDPDT